MRRGIGISIPSVRRVGTSRMVISTEVDVVVEEAGEGMVNKDEVGVGNMEVERGAGETRHGVGGMATLSRHERW